MRIPERKQGRSRRRVGPQKATETAQGAAQKAAEEKVLHALRRTMTHVPARAFKRNASLVKDLGVDSLKVAELSIALEDAFGHPVFMGEIFAQMEEPSRLTVADIAKFLVDGR